jgi:GR25 family glycosyltransferase involved in LPS biosynthesis
VVDKLVPHIFPRYEDDEWKITGPYLDKLHKGSFGPLLSHLKVLKWWYENTTQEYAFIAEDDLSLKTVEYWDFTWDKLVSKFPENWDAVQLTCVRPDKYSIKLRKWNVYDWCVAAYVIKRSYVEKLLKLYPVKNNTFFVGIDYPIVEHCLFIHSENVYTWPVFVENIQHPSTGFNTDKTKFDENGQGEFHVESHNKILNLWKMDKKLYTYINDTENPSTNFELAQWYESLGQTAAAFTYYLRCADRTENKDLSYVCLCRMGKIMEKQKDRNVSVLSCYKRAIALCPTRLEAYSFLVNLLIVQQQWMDAYSYATLALKLNNTYCEASNLPEFQGKYELIFNKGVASFWWGLGTETREIFQDLLVNYWSVMNSEYREALRRNMTQLGCGDINESFNQYEKNKLNTLKFKFENVEKINKNYSQIWQDMFVLSMLNGKQKGTFVEIGGSDPYHGNNTALLEKNFDWSGISIEFNKELSKKYLLSDRNNTDVLNVNALALNYKELFQSQFGKNNKHIDYLQLDIEPCENTYSALLKMPFDEFSFGVITFEHDDYIDPNRNNSNSILKKSRKYLQSKGYTLWVRNVSSNGKDCFEDWYINEKFIKNPNLPKCNMASKKIDSYFIN